MAEYIERGAAIKYLRKRAKPGEYNGTLCAEIVPVYLIKNIPAVNVRENVVGQWIQHYETTSDNETLPYGWECSLCGRWEMEKQPFCNCGAQMLGGAEDG